MLVFENDLWEDWVRNLQARVALLETAIRKHRDERGHGRCWLDDKELYAVLGEPVEDQEFKLPPKEEFLKQCEKYHAERQP